MFKFRPHRELLEEAMTELQIFETKEDLLTYLTTKYNLFSACEKADLEKHLIIEPYRYDYRINWDTYIVYLPDQGILGFTNGPVE